MNARQVGPSRRIALRLRERLGRWRADVHDRLHPGRPTVSLGTVQRRLEIFLTGLYGRSLTIAPAEDMKRRGWWWRFLDALDTPRHLRIGAPLASVDGRSLRLPPMLDAGTGSRQAIARYQIMAVEQAERLARGSARHVPPGGERQLERDLYLLSESVAVDAAIARAVPGLRDAIASARREALAKRPPLESLTEAEREIEQLVRSVLASDPAEVPAAVPVVASPLESVTWAATTVARIGTRKRYRGTAPVMHWGDVHESEADVAFAPPLGGSPMTRLPTPSMATGGGHIAGDDAPEAGKDTGMSERTPDSARELVEDRYGVIEAPDAHGTRGGPSTSLEPESEALPGVAYPEWDARAGEYRQRAALVHEIAPVGGDHTWAAGALTRYAADIRRVRAEFERFRARRLRLTQQKEGDELDVAAVVRSIVDLRTGHTPDERQYTAIRRARRGLAITLLVDVSGSTDTQIGGGMQIIDLEKIALLMASEALDALGDLYSILAFSSHGARDVRVSTVKRTGERNGPAIRERISALTPGGYTRLGAAVRHATSLLTREPAGHRLLLVLSDGKPHDFDYYQGDFGIEDSRQAVFESRARGVYPFCIAIDAEAPEYLPHLFGPAGHTVVRNPEHLPAALLGVVRRLLRQA